MYCNRCGAALQPQQNVCTACGQRQPAASPSQSRLASHVHLLAIFWFIVAVMFGIAALVLLAIGGVAGAAVRASEVPMPARLIGPMVLWSVGVFVALLAAVGFVTGYGLLKVRPWARVLAIVLGFFSLLHPPFGTALGIYTLIVLLPSTAGREYDELAAAAP